MSVLQLEERGKQQQELYSKQKDREMAATNELELQDMLNVERENTAFLSQSLSEIQVCVQNKPTLIFFRIALNMTICCNRQARCEDEIMAVREEAARNPQIFELRKVKLIPSSHVFPLCPVMSSLADEPLTDCA
jgi:hypothetical protein